jgi:hypothetical protein
MKRFSVSEQVINSIFQYLVTRPYQEVAKGIEELQKDIQEILPEADKKEVRDECELPE